MIEHAGTSETGPVRPENEDFIAHHCPDALEERLSKGSLFVVADGVGGSRAGEVASKEAAQCLVASYFESTRLPGKALPEAFQKANLHVYDMGMSHAEYRRMETTLAAVAIIRNQAFIGHVGDTRIYLVRGNEIQQLTRDHSEVGELLRMRLLTPEEARHHPRRNIITRSVGSEPMLQAEFRSVDLELGDTFVLCTDGIWEPVEDADIARLVKDAKPAEACRTITDLAITNGASDNLSLQVIKVVKWEHAAGSEESKPGLWQRALRLFGRQHKDV